MSEPIPRLGTQQRTVYDWAAQWHQDAGHDDDVRECAACLSESPYRVALAHILLTGKEPAQ